jgi:outer membrane murein-binding lipoprotein Lpp
MNNSDKITEILPDGLSESTVEAIFKMVDSIITEQVDDRVKLLEAKVNAFLRQKIDRLKDQAVAELSEENATFRNARLFESVRTLMSLELNSEDADSVVSKVVEEQSELQEEFDVLSEQVNTLVSHNEKLENTVHLLNRKLQLAEENAEKLDGEKARLLEEVENLQAVSEESFRSSEKAVLISEADAEEVSEERTHFNEFLTDEVMKFMPFKTN